jgi:hypothetical protein
MLKTSTADAMMLLTQALHTLPSEPDPRSDFFVQWRTRTNETIERIFGDDPAPSRDFKDIEFSPRRLTRDAEKDEQLRLDACLAGYAQARLLLEQLIASVNQQAIGLAEQSQAAATEHAASQRANASNYGALCSSIAQAVKHDEIDDAGSVLAASAQLLRNLSTGLADRTLRDATERMMAKLAPNGSAKVSPDWEHADLFVWSILMALGELKRCA